MPELERAIDEALENAKEPFDATHDGPFAIFDFDNTCIMNDIAEATLAYLCGNTLLRDTSLLGEKQDDNADYHERVFHTYYALLKEKRIKAAYMLYGLHIERGLAARRQVLSLMAYLKAKGVRVWIMSASQEPAVRAAMKHFGIEADLVAVRSVVRNGVFTSELESPMPIIEGKVECMRKFIDPARSPLLVADDSPTGLPLLETADIKVVVDRGNELGKIARERGWFLI